MPKCGSQIALCDIPIRFDTYKGCGHGCAYCFVSRKTDIKHIGTDESARGLKNFIKGARTPETNWCDWAIPIHWGGMSDPFQPVERVEKRSLECLKVFAETKYPFVVSTKNALIAQDPYLSLIKQCNCVVQFSACSPRYDQIERGASTYAQRLKAAETIAKYKRVNIRIQPYLPAIFRDVLAAIPHLAEIGVHGIILEGMKYTTNAVDGLVSVGGDQCYPVSVLLPQFEAIKGTCHRYGLKFYCGENRLRALSDELCCCGIEGLGWRENRANLNHHLFDDNGMEYTPKMKEVGTAGAWGATEQSTVKHAELLKSSYAEKMEKATKNPYQFMEGVPNCTPQQVEVLRHYFKNAQRQAGISSKEITERLGSFMWGHYIAKAQFAFPTEDAYAKLRTILPNLLPYEQIVQQVWGDKGRARSGMIYGLKSKDNGKR